MKFDQYRIADSIKSNIAELGYKKPTDIQFKTIPHILKGEDVLAIAQTGTGKTAAFAIPILDLVKQKKISHRPSGVKCLVMAPTHELAEQIAKTFTSLGKDTDVSVLCIYGGVDQEPQINRLREGVDIVVATPGRLFDLAFQQELMLNEVEILVLDEADHMLDLGFLKDIQDLMHHVPKYRQTLFFSATINIKIKKLAYSLVSSNAIRIQISPNNTVAKNVEHAVAFIGIDDKRFFLEGMIKNNEESKILVFVRTKVRAERVMKAMQRVDIVSDTIHSDKTQEERDSTMKQYRSGELKVLIATDITARGIDIPDVEFVVNYDLPETPENYVHRVGRTGRGNNKGQAVSFCSDEESELLEAIEENIGKRISRMDISKNEYEKTIDFSEEKTHDLKALLSEVEEFKNSKKKKNKKSKRK